MNNFGFPLHILVGIGVGILIGAIILGFFSCWLCKQCYLCYLKNKEVDPLIVERIFYEESDTYHRRRPRNDVQENKTIIVINKKARTTSADKSKVERNDNNK